MPSAISVDDIAAFSDAQLAQFMEQHRRPNGDFDLPVDGWEKLSKAERDKLAERLKAQQRALTQTAASRPLDLDQLDARLRQVSDGDSTSSRAQPQAIQTARRRTPPYDEEEGRKENETYAYQDLVDDGGRPLFPIGLLERVSRKPREYREMLRPWQLGGRRRPWQVFQTQLERWQDFRKWQKDNRGLEDDGDNYPAYVERMKLYYTRAEYTDGLAKIEADPSCLEDTWEFRHAERQRQRYYHREWGCDGFSDYMDAMKRRLAQHGFTRPIWCLKEDPKQQDKLTTWIEYLYFEYWWLDRYTKSIERRTLAYDTVWQELVDSNILWPNETQEYIGTDEWAREQWKNLQEVGKEMFPSANARVDSVRKFVSAKLDRKESETNAARHTILLEWILQQIPLIEAELAQAGSTDVETNASKSKKRKLVSLETGLREQSPKRQKPEDSEPGPLPPVWSEDASGWVPQEMPQRLRRSPRIAARNAARQTNSLMPLASLSRPPSTADVKRGPLPGAANTSQKETLAATKHSSSAPNSRPKVSKSHEKTGPTRRRPSKATALLSEPRDSPSRLDPDGTPRATPMKTRRSRRLQKTKGK